MAVRGAPSLSGPAGKGPLPGVLRDLDRRQRRTEQRHDREGLPGPAGPEGPPGPPGPAGPAPLATVAVTGGDGRVSWVFDPPLGGPPVVAATPVDAAPGDNATVTAALEEATAVRVVVRVWRTQPILGLGLLPLVPAGAGIQVHLAAFPAAPQPQG